MGTGWFNLRKRCTADSVPNVLRLPAALTTKDFPWMHFLLFYSIFGTEGSNVIFATLTPLSITPLDTCCHSYAALTHLRYLEME